MGRVRYVILSLVGLLALVAGSDAAENARTDLYGDPLPLGAVARLGTIRLRQSNADGKFSTDSKLRSRPGHAGWVPALAVSPKGNVIASVDSDQVMWLWDAAAGKPLHGLANSEDNYSPGVCLFSPDSKQVFSGSASGMLRIWEVATGKEQRRFKIGGVKSKSIAVHAARISADGKRLAVVAEQCEGADTGQLQVWDLATGKRLMQRPYRYRSRFRPMSCMPWIENYNHAALAPDGESATVWLGDRIGLAEIATNDLSAVLPRNIYPPLVFSPDGRRIAALMWQPKQPRGGVKCLSLIEAATGTEVVRLDVSDFEYYTFTPNGRAVIVGDRKKLSVWDTDSGEQLHELAWPESIRNARGETIIYSLASLPDGRVATGMTEGDILLWDLAPATWPMPKRASDLDYKELDSLWADLASEARTAYRAISKLAAAEQQTLPFLRDRLHPAAVDDKRIEKLLADLDSDSFEKREAAMRELTRLHYYAEARLRRARAEKPSLEMRRRLDAILAEPKRLPPETLRTLRAIAVLERIGTPEARRILEKLSGGADGYETSEAKKALQRLKRS